VWRRWQEGAARATDSWFPGPRAGGPAAPPQAPPQHAAGAAPEAAPAAAAAAALQSRSTSTVQSATHQGSSPGRRSPAQPTMDSASCWASGSGSRFMKLMNSTPAGGGRQAWCLPIRQAARLPATTPPAAQPGAAGPERNKLQQHHNPVQLRLLCTGEQPAHTMRTQPPPLAPPPPSPSVASSPPCAWPAPPHASSP
jgi:hypothetical protein